MIHSASLISSRHVVSALSCHQGLDHSSVKACLERLRCADSRGLGSGAGRVSENGAGLEIEGPYSA